MSARRVVVVGASAGGIEALRTVVAALPETFQAAMCVVLHTSAESPGVLADILNRSAQLPVSQAHDGQRLEAGQVYVAGPDRHLLVEPGRLRVTKGPREHRFRPAIDPLFRSAAQVFGPGAIGVVLTGNLDDGTSGLWTIKRLGGIAIVQDPSEALFSSMPLYAMKHVQIDHVVPLSRMAPLLVELITELPRGIERVAVPRHIDTIDTEVAIANEKDPRDAGMEEFGKPSPYACPDCHGVLLELDEGGRIRFRCHIGHAFSVESLLAAVNDVTEYQMSAAVRALEEGSILMNNLATQLKQQKRGDESLRMMDASNRAKQQSEVIRQLVLGAKALPVAGD
jgi:two-component system, chemotaxis family, protein-glutamate methylesterase/glutaminase